MSQSSDKGNRKLGVTVVHNKNLNYNLIKIVKCEKTGILIVPKTNI